MQRPDDDAQKMADLQAFIDAAAAQLHIEPPFDETARDGILGLTGRAAHGIVRPAAPIASLMVGYLVGSGRAASWTEATEQVKRLVRDHVDQGRDDR